MLRPLLLAALLCAGCAGAPTAPPQGPPPIPPQVEPIVAALDALQPQLGKVDVEVVIQLFMVSGYTEYGMLSQGMDETLLIHFPPGPGLMGADFVFAIYDTETRVLLEARLFRLDRVVAIKLDPTLKGSEQ